MDSAQQTKESCQADRPGSMRHGWRIILVCSAALLADVMPAVAIDVNSSDYLPAAPGTNLLLFYSQYAERSEYVSSSGVVTSADTGLASYVNILQYVHYLDVGGFTVAPQVLIPTGTLYDAKLGGVNLGSAAGFSDPIFAMPVWLVNNAATQTYVGLTPYLFVPLGQYDAGSPLNMGENRWKLDLQAGWRQGLGNGFALQLTADVTWYGVNNEAGTGRQSLTQDNTYQLQAWLSYSFAKTWSVAAGYAKLWGGTEYLDGIPTGNSTERDQIRLELSTFVTPTFQVLGLVQRDFNTSGGFPEDFRGTVRLGGVDGFDEDEAQGEGDDSSEGAFGFFAAERYPFEALELSETLLDAGAAPIERLREEGRWVLRIGFERNGGCDAAGSGERPVGLGVIALVGEHRARFHIGTEIQQQFEQRAVAGLAAGQVEGDRLAVEVALEVYFGGEAAARATEGVAFLPPFAPAAETWARTTVESNIWTRWAVRLSEARVSKNSSNTPAWRSRQNRFQTLFQDPNSAGRARQVMLCTVK